ncbi:MAG: helix-turn-helix domain-containing protein, partial [Huintestinicola sp.]
MNISEKIQLLRRENNWSQDELAEKLDVSRQSVSKWESGKALPDSEKVLAMAQLFDVSTDFLLKDEMEPVFEDSDEPQEAENSDKPQEEAPQDHIEKEKRKLTWKKIVALVAAVCIVIAAVVPLAFGGYSAF